MSREKNSKLREWFMVLSNKDWLETAAIVDAGLIYISPVSRTALGNIIKHQKKLEKLVLSNKRGDEFELDNFEKITKQKITTKDWGNIKSEIPKACYLFKKIQIIKGKHISTDLDMQAFFLENRMEKNLASINNANDKTINQKQINDSFQGFNLMRSIVLQLDDLNYINDRKGIIKGKKTITLNDYQDALELFYYENKLQFLCQKTNRIKFHNNHNFTEEELILDELIPEKYLALPQIKIYAKVYYMMKNKCEKTFFEIKDLLLDEEVRKKLSPKYIGDIYKYLISHSISASNEGKEKYIDLYLEFIQILSKDNLLLLQGEFPIWSFKNIVKAAIKANRYEWADNFIETEKNKIAKIERKAIVEYCTALVNYRRGNFKDAYDLINYQPLSQDPLIRIDTLILLLHIYLDYDPNDSFPNRRNNLRNMINSKFGISDRIIDKWKLTLNKISKIQNAIDKAALKEIKSEISMDIEKGIFYTGRNWMLDFLNRKI